MREWIETALSGFSKDRELKTIRQGPSDMYIRTLSIVANSVGDSNDRVLSFRALKLESLVSLGAVRARRTTRARARHDVLNGSPFDAVALISFFTNSAYISQVSQVSPRSLFSYYLKSETQGLNREPRSKVARECERIEIVQRVL